MTIFRALLLVVVLLLLIVGAGAWYLLGANGVSAAKLVPGDTLVFACIPNGAGIGVSYSDSLLRKIVDSPNVQPAIDEIQRAIGDKNLALLKLLAPDLSGQSFIAITHFDPAKPAEIGFVAGMKPKLGSDNFDTFIQQVNASYPDLAQHTKTGRDTLLGLDYQWIESNEAPGKRICVARYHGWILTALGETSLQDCLERLQGKSAAPSLADNPDFVKSHERVGADSQALAYVDYARVMSLWVDRFGNSNPAAAASMKKRLATIGGAALGTSFVGGEIVDHLSILQPKQAQLDAGATGSPCSFDTLKFTSPDTRFYFGGSVNWQQIWKNLQDQLNADPSGGGAIFGRLTSMAQAENIDVEKNIIDPLGQEFAMQIEWASDALYPDVGFFLKVDKPDDFKPTVAALIDAARKNFSTSAVITEMNSGGQNFATLKFVNPTPLAPTITEDGPYFGLFLSETNAVRSMARTQGSLTNNPDFIRQIGDKRNGATSIIFLDSPKLLDQAYRTALPYFSMGAMINPTIAAIMKDRQMPPDLTWLAPMGTWSAISTSDDDGMTTYSVSGVGNQGLIFMGALGGTTLLLERAGVFPQTHYTTPITSPPPTPAAPLTPPTPLVPPAPPAPAGSTH